MLAILSTFSCKQLTVLYCTHSFVTWHTALLYSRHATVWYAFILFHTLFTLYTVQWLMIWVPITRSTQKRIKKQEYSLNKLLLFMYWERGQSCALSIHLESSLNPPWITKQLSDFQWFKCKAKSNMPWARAGILWMRPPIWLSVAPVQYCTQLCTASWEEIITWFKIGLKRGHVNFPTVGPTPLTLLL